MSDSLFIGALGTLATVIGILWKVNQGNAVKIEKRADCIEKKNDENTKVMLDMRQEIGEMKGEISLAKQVIPKIDDLHEDFLTAYPDIRKKD